MTRRVRVALVLLAAAYVVLATAYSLATPAGEGPDEPGHVAYVQFLLAEHRLPRHGEVGEPLKQQVKHPPLYYVLGALWTSWADYDGLLFYPNPEFGVNFGHMEAVAAHRHGPEEQWPWAPRYLATRALRLLSVLLGLVVVLATFATARVALPADPWLAVTAAAVAGFLPQFLFMSGVANNDALANASAALATLAAVRVATGALRRGDLAYLGVAVGLAVLAKLTTLAFVAVAVLAVALAARRARSWRVVGAGAAWGGGSFALVAGWWFLRNVWVNGDLLGWGGFTRAAEANARTRPLSIDLPDYFQQQWQSFVGRFGWMAVPLPEAIYRAFAVLLGAAVVGLAALVVWRWRRPAEPRGPQWAAGGAGVALLAATVALVYASVFRLAFQFDLVVAQGRYLFTGLAAFAVLFALGLVGWWPERRRPAGAIALAGAWFALGLYGLAAALTPAFALPPPSVAAELAAVPRRLNVLFRPWVRLEAYDLAAERVAPGDTLAASLYFRPTGPPDVSLNLGVALVDGRGEGDRERVPLGGTYPSTSWLADRPWREEVGLRVPPESAGASPVRSGLVISWFPAGWAGEPLPVRVDDRAAGYSFTVGPVYIVPPGPPEPAHTPIERGDTWRAPGAEARLVRLAAAGVTPAASGGTGLELRLRWQAEAPLAEDLAAFVHVDGPDGQPLATADADPAGLPSRLWRPGDDFMGPHPLDLADVPPGAHPLRVGLYRRADGARLPAYAADGRRWPDDAVPLGTVVVDPAGGARFTPSPGGSAPGAAATARPAP